MKSEICSPLRRTHAAVLLLAGVAAAVCLIHAEPAAGTGVVDRIVAVVNDDVITQHDVELALRPFLENIKAQGMSPDLQRQSIARLRREAVDSLIDAKLTEQEAKRHNITVSEEEIDQHIEQLKKTHRIGDEEIRAMLAGQGMSMAEYRQDIKGMIQRTKLVNREVRSRVVVTREEVTEYYEKNLAKYGGSRKYHLWNLFIRMPPNAAPEQREAAQAELQAALGDLRTGTSFEELVRRRAGGGEGVQGADLGFFSIEELTPRLREVVRLMKPGEVSPLVETEFGYQVLFVQQLQDAAGRPLAEVEAEITDTLYRERVDGRIKTWLSDLRRRSHIKVIEPK
ncbi:MAG: SurA N-terminal domain-containing protein [Desulfobacterales bacterium]|jgi:peptidyl-prolyl cis-trans isomerase SurA|nr:SurA N-terminal domain-containing protein [Desulfobacterales bacterium]